MKSILCFTIFLVSVASFAMTTSAQPSPEINHSGEAYRLTDTPEPTRTPFPEDYPVPVGFTPVTANADWEPVIQEFEGIPMVLVPVGCFTMGNRRGLAGDERSEHEQCFEEPFWMDLTEVTNEQYGSTGHREGDEYPRDSVNWRRAVAFCESRDARLPTEAEWEYAARGPDGRVYPWGDEFIAEYTVYHENSDGQSAPAGSIPEGASWVGALDMSGNLFEWTSSLYDRYPYDATDGREDMNASGQRVLRGGSWQYENRRENVRADYRVRDPVSRSDSAVGFRCVRDYQFPED